MKKLIPFAVAIAVLAGCDQISFEPKQQAAAKPDNPPLVLAQAPQSSVGASAPQAPPATRGEVVPLPDFTPLMKIDGPAVVNVITVNKQAKNGRARAPGAQGPQGQDDDPMAEFFRRFAPGPGGPGGGDQEPKGGLGSG